MTALPTPSGDPPAHAVTTPEASSSLQPDQAAVYRIYCQLRAAAAAATLAGRLVLSVGFRARGAELALATAIAQGGFLGLEPDAASLKHAVRTGACDFMVNTLDEALRVLKNEIRKGTPLSAGLLGDPQPILEAMVERGVQPDWIAGPGDDAAIRQLVSRGATLLATAPQSVAAGDSLTRLHAANPADMRRLDAMVARLVAGDPVRRDWMQHAPAYFSRQLPPVRVVQLWPPEIGSLREQLLALVQETSIQPGVSVDTPEGSITF